MDPTALRTLTLRLPVGPLLLSDLRSKSRTRLPLSRYPNTTYPPLLTSTYCSCSAERGGVDTLSNGIARAGSEVSCDKLLQVVLVSPQIPGNMGCIVRTCAASAVGLHLVGASSYSPLGYTVDDVKLKRAGLDYWPYPVTVTVNAAFTNFIFCSFDNARNQPMTILHMHNGALCANMIKGQEITTSCKIRGP